MARADLHVQVIAKDARKHDRRCTSYCKGIRTKHTYVDSLYSRRLQSDEALKEKRASVLPGTAIYTAMQAYLAAKSGASYTAPYVNRIDNMGYNGVGVAKEIQDILRFMDWTGILAASFKNSQQVLELCEYGIEATTVAPSVIDGFVNNVAITAAVDAFVKNWKSDRRG